MRTIAVMNQKGGVGKTTTSINLAAGLAAKGKRVCLIDLDPQGHASLHLGVEAAHNTPTVYQVFSGEASLSDVRRLVSTNLSVVPANVNLVGVEVELVGKPNREFILRDALKDLLATDPFDHVIIDCPPSLGVLTINALTAVKEVLIPLQPHFLALQGLSKLLETTALVTRRLNPGLRVSGVLFCLYETGTRLAADITDDLTIFLEKSDPETPWANAHVFQTRIRRNIKLAEAPSFGQAIFSYAPNCSGAQDYGSLIDELLQSEAQQQRALARAG